MDVCHLAPGSFEHAWHVASVAVALHGLLPGWRLVSEREVRVHEREERELLASVRLGHGECAARHRPDLALIDPEGGVCAVEVELSVKSRVRLQAICTGYARARHLRHTFYLAAGAPARALARTVREPGAVAGSAA
jgi:hypothetical protein